MTTCPNCNTPLLAELSGQAICPTCGASLSPADVAAQPDVVAGPRQTNRQVAFIILLVMLFIAAAGLIYALKTVEFRRANDKKEANSEPRTERVFERSQRPVPLIALEDSLRARLWCALTS